jgi:hypothetical protein
MLSGLPNRRGIICTNAVLSVAAYDRHLEQLFDTITRVAGALLKAGVEYRLVGGMAVFLHVHERDPLAARLTRDVDIAIDRRDLDAVASAVHPIGLEYRYTAGLDMLVDRREPKARSAVHLVFVRERVRPDDPEPVPDFSPPVRTAEGVLLTPVPDLVRMKLTSFRLKDKLHLQDMDSVGLITPEIESSLPEVLAERLRLVRSME